MEKSEEKKFDLTKLQEADVEKHFILTPEEKEQSKFGKLVFPFPEERNEIVAEGDPMDFVVSPQAYFRGASQIPGAEFNQSYQIFVKPFFLDRVQHRHVKDEYLVFLGASFPNVFDFDAKIEFTIGKGEEAETYVITQPTIIRVPAGTWYCPIYFNIRKPVMFQATWLDGIWHKVLRREKEGGGYEYYYEGDNLRHCRLEPDKWCNICGKCFAGLNETAKDNKAYEKPDWAE